MRKMFSTDDKYLSFQLIFEMNEIKPHVRNG